MRHVIQIKENLQNATGLCVYIGMCVDRQALVDCYLPHIRPTQSCTEAFDKYFRNFVSEKQYRNACRCTETLFLLMS